MLREIVLCFVVLLPKAIAAGNPAGDVTYPLADNCPQGGCPAPSFDKGYLFQPKATGNAPADGLAVFDPAGTLAYQVNIKAPDGSPGYLHSHPLVGAADSDGTVAVPSFYGGYAGAGRVKGGGIVLLDRNGNQMRIIDTARFLPDAACFGPDHSIWMIGTQYTPLESEDSSDHVERGDYHLIRKYSLDGVQLGSFLPRSSFPPGLPPGEAGWMRASNDRIGIMTYPGIVANNPEWVELDLAGNLIGRWKLGPQLTADPVTHHMTYSLGGFAFTSDGRLFAQATSCATLRRCSYRLASLDRATSTWQTVDGVGLGRFFYLMGADGSNLVIWDRAPLGGGGIRLIRITL